MTTFEIFIEIYQQKEEELQKINKYLPSNKLSSMEFALKISRKFLVNKIIQLLLVNL